MFRKIIPSTFNPPLSIQPPRTIEELRELEKRFPYRNFATQSRDPTPELGEMVVQRAYQIGLGAREMLKDSSLDEMTRAWLTDTAETFPNKALDMYFQYEF